MHTFNVRYQDGETQQVQACLIYYTDTVVTLVGEGEAGKRETVFLAALSSGVTVCRQG